VNVASAIKVNGNQIAEARLAVARWRRRPLRLEAVERAIAGKPLNEETATMAGEMAIEARSPAPQRVQDPADAQSRARAVRGGALPATT